MCITVRYIYLPLSLSLSLSLSLCVCVCNICFQNAILQNSYASVVLDSNVESCVNQRAYKQHVVFTYITYNQSSIQDFPNRSSSFLFEHYKQAKRKYTVASANEMLDKDFIK